VPRQSDGATTDFAEASRVAVRLKYLHKDIGKWRCILISTEQTHRFFKLEIAKGQFLKVLRRYKSAMVLKDVLLNRGYPNNSDIPNYRGLLRASIHKAHYNWLSQIITIELTKGPLEVKPSPSEATIEINRQLMQSLVPRVSIGSVSSRSDLGRNATKRCDMCPLVSGIYEVQT
jgi:hypothetical protein